jgi:hypothetical protein
MIPPISGSTLNDFILPATSLDPAPLVKIELRALAPELSFLLADSET